MGRLIIKLLQKLFSRRKPALPKKPAKTPPRTPPKCTKSCPKTLPKPAKRPARRHDPCKTAGNDPTKAENSMMDPDVDVTADISAINRGDFVRNSPDLVVGQRTYGYHPETGTLYPKSGPGIIPMGREQHQFLKQLNSGTYENALKFAKNMPNMDQNKIEQVLKVWRKCK